MSWFDYMSSLEIKAPFYALIMAAMRRADTENATKLAAAFPEIWEELKCRYNAPGGHLISDT